MNKKQKILKREAKNVNGKQERIRNKNKKKRGQKIGKENYKV